LLPKKLNKFLENLKTLASESFSTVSSPIQYAAVEAYSGNYDDYKLNTTKILFSVGNYAYKKLRSNKVLINPPQGGFYLMPEFTNKKYKNSSELCKVILNQTGVAVLPGSEFGFSSKKMIVRLSYTDFDGENFLNNFLKTNKLDDATIEKHAPNVAEGIKKLSKWSKI